MNLACIAWQNLSPIARLILFCYTAQELEDFFHQPNTVNYEQLFKCRLIFPESPYTTLPIHKTVEKIVAVVKISLVVCEVL